MIVSTAGNAQGTFKPADRVYNKSGDYVRGFFGGETPKKSSVWVTGKLRDSVEQIINGADSIPLRYSYWRNEDRTTWVLDSIGHTWPITAGIVVENGKIIDVFNVLMNDTPKTYDCNPHSGMFENKHLNLQILDIDNDGHNDIRLSGNWLTPENTNKTDLAENAQFRSKSVTYSFLYKPIKEFFILQY